MTQAKNEKRLWETLTHVNQLYHLTRLPTTQQNSCINACKQLILYYDGIRGVLYERRYESNTSNFFLRKCNCNNNNTYSYTFCNYTAIFHKSPSFSTHFCQRSKIPCLYFGAHHERYKETLNKLRQRIRTVRPERNTKDVLLLHDNARPDTRLCTSQIWRPATVACLVL
jgi:peptidoglycan/xylan/chitin deacetylase (PgdA/CDA1 family)